jgi:hypothetical protein
MPLVRVTYDGEITDAAFRLHLNEYAELIRRGQRYGVIFDATRAARPSATQRRMMASFMTEHRADLARLCVGGAFVITSPLIRGAMTAILWISPMPFPHVVVASEAEALGWVRSRLSEL